MELEWWQRGEAGEKVLDNIEYYLINNNDVVGFCRWATEFGIHISGIRKILDVHNEDKSYNDETYNDGPEDNLHYINER